MVCPDARSKRGPQKKLKKRKSVKAPMGGREALPSKSSLERGTKRKVIGSEKRSVQRKIKAKEGSYRPHNDEMIKRGGSFKIKRSRAGKKASIARRTRQDKIPSQARNGPSPRWRHEQGGPTKDT